MLLRYHYGGAERDRVFADVRFAGEDDTRQVLLRPEEIERLLAACQALGYAELGQIGFRWHRVRERAGLDHVRFKDLRSQVAIYGERAGVPLSVLKSAMGHQGEAMTQRYAKDKEAEEKRLIEEYKEKFYNPYQAAARGYVDDVIEPSQTRPRLIQALELSAGKRDNNPSRKHGNIPL